MCNFSGKIKYSSLKIKRRKTTGENLLNDSESSSKLHRLGLLKLSGDQLASGNRTGPSRSALNNIKSQSSSYESAEELMLAIMKLRLDICNEDEALAVKNIQRRPFLGYIHHLNMTDEINTVLFTENSLKWYENIIKHNYAFIDATGSLFRDVKLYKRLLYYAITVRHPFPGKTPLTVAEYIYYWLSFQRFLNIFHFSCKQVCSVNAFALITNFSKDHCTRF